MRNLLSRLSIIMGILVIAYFCSLLWQRDYVRKVPVKSLPVRWEENLQYPTGEPIQILIPDLHINLPIIKTVMTHGIWNTTDNGVSYLKSTPLPGNRGNSVMYGHNWPALFGRLQRAKPDETITIIFSDNTIKRFTIYFTAIIPANQMHILDQTKDRRITLFTCTGFLDLKRFVVVARLTTKQNIQR